MDVSLNNLAYANPQEVAIRTILGEKRKQGDGSNEPRQSGRIRKEGLLILILFLHNLLSS